MGGISRKLLELNKIHNIDTIKGLKLIPENSINLVFTDPPYKLVGGGTCA